MLKLLQYCNFIIIIVQTKLLKNIERERENVQWEKVIETCGHRKLSAAK